MQNTTTFANLFPLVLYLIRTLDYILCKWHCARHVWPILHSIWLCIAAELIRVAIAELHVFPSREWHFAPSGSRSRSDLPFRVAATIIPWATFKHIPFALQFVQPGIVTTAVNPLRSSTPHWSIPEGRSPSLAFSAPSRVAFCAFYVQSVFFLFYFSLAEEQSIQMNPLMQPPGKFNSYQEEHSCCESGCMCMHAHHICC